MKWYIFLGIAIFFVVINILVSQLPDGFLLPLFSKLIDLILYGSFLEATLTLGIIGYILSVGATVIGNLIFKGSLAKDLNLFFNLFAFIRFPSYYLLLNILFVWLPQLTPVWLYPKVLISLIILFIITLIIVRIFNPDNLIGGPFFIISTGFPFIITYLITSVFLGFTYDESLEAINYEDLYFGVKIARLTQWFKFGLMLAILYSTIYNYIYETIYQ